MARHRAPRPTPPARPPRHGRPARLTLLCAAATAALLALCMWAIANGQDISSCYRHGTHLGSWC